MYFAIKCKLSIYFMYFAVIYTLFIYFMYFAIILKLYIYIHTFYVFSYEFYTKLLGEWRATKLSESSEVPFSS